MMAHALPVPRFWAVGPSSRPEVRAVRHLSRARNSLMERPAVEVAHLNALVVAVGRARDRAAFKELFDHFAPRVKGYLMRLGAGGAVAEDLAQEAMLTLWRKAELFDPEKASASTWIFTIARNLRIDAIRKERRPEIDANDPTFLPEAERQADETMDWAKAEDRLKLALADLPREQAQIIELSFLADKPHSAIAAELGLPLGTVKSRIRLAMARLRLALGDGT
jgi:RNA polymerase sigma-70 factor (ECF subfamily)